MDKYVKVCKVHGSLTIEQTTKENRKNNVIYYRCKACAKDTNIRFCKKNPEKVKQYAKNYRDKACLDGRMRWRLIERKFGFKKEEYFKLLISQNNVCAICKKEETAKHKTYKNAKKFLRVDHCHKTGKIRGLLCHKCNTAIGSLQDSIEILKSAISYLYFHSS